MSSGVVCPACQKALPESVVKGPAQAVVRCEGCATLLLWSHGKVVRSARSNPSTLQGIPVQKGAAPPAAATPPPRPVAKTLMGIPTSPPTPEPPKPEPPKPEPPKPEPPRAKAPEPPRAKAPEPPRAKAPEPSKAKAPEPTPAAPKATEAPKNKAPDSKPHIAAAIAQAPKSVPGPMEDPSEWFGDTQMRDSSDDEPTSVGPAPGPDPLPPLEPEPTNLTSRKAESAPAPRKTPPKTAELKVDPPKPKAEPASAPTIQAPAPVLPKSEPPAPSLFAQSTEPVASQKTKMAQAPSSAPTMQAPAPVLPKSEPPKKTKDPSPLPLPPSLSAPPQKVEPNTPTPLGGSVEPVLDLTPDRRRPPIVYAAVAAAGAMVLVVGLIFAFSGEKAPAKPPEPVAVVEKPAPVAPKPASPVEKPAPVAAPPPVEKPAPPVVAKVDPPIVRPSRLREPVINDDPPPTPRKKGRTLGGKKVVLDEPSSKPAAVQDDPAQVERAREAYKRGNERLFAGNSSGAVAAYKESLSIYPGYVAGYRGLGLAYAQEGNTAEALKALRTYVRTAPNAHDVPLIMKRIERLEKNPQD